MVLPFCRYPLTVTRGRAQREWMRLKSNPSVASVCWACSVALDDMTQAGLGASALQVSGL